MHSESVLFCCPTTSATVTTVLYKGMWSGCPRQVVGPMYQIRSFPRPERASEKPGIYTGRDPPGLEEHRLPKVHAMFQVSFRECCRLFMSLLLPFRSSRWCHPVPRNPSAPIRAPMSVDSAPSDSLTQTRRMGLPLCLSTLAQTKPPQLIGIYGNYPWSVWVTLSHRITCFGVLRVTLVIHAIFTGPSGELTRRKR